MTPEQTQEFESHGITRLPGAVAADVVRAIRDRVWEQAEVEQRIRRDDPTSWRRVKPAIMKRPKEKEGVFEPILGPKPTAEVDSILGEGNWGRPKFPGQLLMSPPTPGEWVLPHQVWHMDMPAPGGVKNSPGVQLFLLLDALAEHGGGTIVIGGSHRLVPTLPEREDPTYAGHSAQIRDALKRRVPWFSDLCTAGANDERIERFVGRATEHEGIPLRVLEMTGEPGDVFIMHLWMVHNASMNSSNRMRMMLTERLLSPAPPWLVRA